VYAFKRIFDPTVAASYESYFEQIAGGSGYSSVDAKSPTAVKAFLDGLGVSAPDASTFVVKLSGPAPWFKWVLSLWVAAPIKKADVDAVGSANFGAVTAEMAAKIHGNGPFIISEVVPKDHITLTPNKQYRKQPILQKVIFYYFTDGNVEFAKFQNGELDITRGVPSPDVPVVLGDPKLSKQVLRSPTLLTWWLDFNTTQAPLNNANLRLALAKSIDRNSYITNIRKGIGTAITSLIPKGERGYAASDVQKFDCTAAKALLAKAKSEGVTDAQLNGLHYEYSASSARKPGSEFLQQQWQTCLGINVIVDAIESKTHSKNLHNHTYIMGGIQGWQADYPDGQDWYNIFITGSGQNFAAWSNKQYDDLVKKGDNAPLQADRDAAYAAAEKLLETEAPVMFLYQDEKFLLIASKVKGYTSTPLDDDWIGDVSTATTMYIAA
jgi:oligopeptide transport system substrate-binding protein